MRKIFFLEEDKNFKKIYKSDGGTITFYLDGDAKQIMIVNIGGEGNGIYLYQNENNNLWFYKDKTIGGLILEMTATYKDKEIELEIVIK